MALFRASAAVRCCAKLRCSWTKQAASAFSTATNASGNQPIDTSLYDTSQFTDDFVLEDHLQGKYIQNDKLVIVCVCFMVCFTGPHLFGILIILYIYFIVYRDVVTLEEEALLVKELNPVLRKKPYEGGHWDVAIKGYRETEQHRCAESLVHALYLVLRFVVVCSTCLVSDFAFQMVIRNKKYPRSAV